MPQETGFHQIDIDADLSLDHARGTHAALCAKVAACRADQPVRLEVGSARVTVPALQLLCATRLALQARGVDVALGPVAAGVIASDPGPQPRTMPVA